MNVLNNYKVENILILLIPFLGIFSIFFLELTLVYISFSFLYRSFKNKNFYYFKNKFVTFFTLFYCYILLRYIFIDKDIFFLSSSVIFYFRFGLYVIALYYFLDNIPKLENHFLMSVLFSFTILIIDSFIQFFLGQNILGFELSGGNRVSSFFGEELILGSYLLKFLPFLYILLIKNIYNQKLYFFSILILMLTEVVIFISGERAAFIMMIALTIYFLLILKNLRTMRIIFFFISAAIVLYISFNSSAIKERIVNDTIREITLSENVTNNQIFDKKDLKYDFYLISPTHTNYFYTAFNMFKDNKIFGKGPKIYRYICDDPKFRINTWSCSTHPHNYYIQILAELGILGFLFVGIFYLYICGKILLLLTKKMTERNNYMSCIMCFFLINLWPITSTGNFFNNWISIFLYLPFSFFLFANKKYQYSQ